MKKKKLNESEILEELMSPGSWYMFPERFVSSGVMNPNQAVLVAFLISHSRRNKKGAVSRWFYCTTATMMKKTYYSPDKQQRIIAFLKKKGFLKTKRVGLPPVRWFKLNLSNIWDAIIKRS